MAEITRYTLRPGGVDEGSEEDLVDFDRAIEIFGRFFTVVAIYSPDDEVLAMHWAVDDKAMSASLASIRKDPAE